ncbi:EEV glycoprotein [Hypsugopox virus]|nr:EEV glycoprotein [Hypsugopox virus]
MANVIVIYCAVGTSCLVLIVYVLFMFRHKIKKWYYSKKTCTRLNSITYMATKTYSIDSVSTISSSQSDDWVNDDQNTNIYANFRSSKRVKGFIASVSNKNNDNNNTCNISLSSWEDDDPIYINTPTIVVEQENEYSLPPPEEQENEYSLPPPEEQENEYSLPPPEELKNVITEHVYEIPEDEINFKLPSPTATFVTIPLTSELDEDVYVNVDKNLSSNEQCDKSIYYDCCWINSKELDEHMV